jgi:hypothetical protein
LNSRHAYFTVTGRKLRLGLPNIEILRTTLKYDAAFLATLNIMDYSLLVGIHEQSSRKVGRRHSGVRTSVKFSRLTEKKSSMTFALGTKSATSSIFQSYAGGIKSAPEANEIYFIGIIDILQVLTDLSGKFILSHHRLRSCIMPESVRRRYLNLLPKAARSCPLCLRGFMPIDL